MKEDTSRRRLLDAAKTLLWEQGYERTSPQDVLTAAGVGKGSLYHHFPGKRDLARAALEEVSAEWRDRTLALLADDLPPLERLRRWLTLPRDGLRGCRIGRLANENAVFDAALHAPIAAYFQAVEQQVATVIAAAVTAGTLPSGLDPETTARTLVATVQGGYILSRALQDPARCGQACQGAMALLDALTLRTDTG